MTNIFVWLIVHHLKWDALWYANPGPTYLQYLRIFGPRWHAGTWTGPDGDLVCVKKCHTSAEAERCLSPSGWTPGDAVLRALWHRGTVR